MIFLVYILPTFRLQNWVSAQKCVFVHQKFLGKCLFLVYILGFGVHFVATLPTFCPSFLQKVGRICTHKMVFCTHKIEEKSVNLMDFGLIFGIFDCFVCTNGVCVYILWPKTHFFFLFNHDKKFIYFI